MCNVSVNGESADLKCGETTCLGGTTITCEAGGSTTQGEQCKGSSSGATSGGCALFACANTKACGGIAPCFSTATAGTNYCYEQEGSPSQCSNGTTATSKQTSNGPTTICVPSTCPQPDTFIP